MDNLASIVDGLARIEAKLDAFLAKNPPRASAPAAQSSGAVATDADLDSQYGDEELKFQLAEKWWQSGGDYAGKRMSQCPPDYLDAVAKANEAQAHAKNKSGDPDEIKKAGYKSRTAARARGWAARLRARPPEPAFDGSDDSIPF